MTLNLTHYVASSYYEMNLRIYCCRFIVECEERVKKIIMEWGHCRDTNTLKYIINNPKDKVYYTTIADTILLPMLFSCGFWPIIKYRRNKDNTITETITLLSMTTLEQEHNLIGPSEPHTRPENNDPQVPSGPTDV